MHTQIMTHNRSQSHTQYTHAYQEGHEQIHLYQCQAPVRCITCNRTEIHQS